jgi:1,4-dihydroxy-2-naphthoyl-CoA synthase
MAEDSMLYDTSDGLATITINRPERLNALRPSDLAAMAELVEQAHDDPAVGVVVVTGAGERAFCAGGDLDNVAAEQIDGFNPLGSKEIQRWVLAFRNCAKPILAKVRGHCVGLGNELNVLCDLTIAGESARFAQAGPRVGSVPMVGGTQLLPLVCGLKRAKEILFLCRSYSGQAAVDMGLANVVVPDDQLDAEVAQWVEELLTKSPQSLRVGKMSLSYLFDIQWPGLQLGRELTGWFVGSYEMREGAQAFAEKRAPRFRREVDR